MADHPRDEIPNAAINAVPANNIVDSTAPDPKEQTETMELHHPHHVTHKKKWPEYLLEFFMLFLAVFLGFIAENTREHIVERQREKEYIVSMIQDLKTDTTNLGSVIKSYRSQLKDQDTLLNIFSSADTGYNKRFMSKMSAISGFTDFIYTDATIQQLKSSGAFRLIRNKKAVDSINAYSSAVNRTYINTNDLMQTLHEISTAENDFINFRSLHDAFKSGMKPDQMQAAKIDMLISHDRKDLDRFYNRIVEFRNSMINIRETNFVPLKDQATNLIAFLKKEYHVEDE